MATLSEDYQNYFAIDKAGFVPAYHIPTSLQQTLHVQAMPMCPPEKSLGMVAAAKPHHYSPVPIASTSWQDPNTENRLQCLDHLAAAAAGIKISSNVYPSYGLMTSSTPGLQSMQQQNAAAVAAATASYNQSVFEKMHFQHQQDKMQQQMQYQQQQQRHMVAQEEMKASLINAAAHKNAAAAAAAAAAAQYGLYTSPARPAPRLPITQYLYDMYGSKYRYANPVVIQQYPQGSQIPQEQWNQARNGIPPKHMESGTFDKSRGKDRKNPKPSSGLPSPYKVPTNERILPISPTPKHPSSSSSASSMTKAQDEPPEIAASNDDIEKHSANASAASASAVGPPLDSCPHPKPCHPCEETSRLLYNYCKTTPPFENSQNCKDASSSTNSTPNTSSAAINTLKNDGGGTDSTNSCNNNSNNNNANSNKKNQQQPSWPGLPGGDYPGSYPPPSVHPNLWPSSTSTSSTPPLYTTQFSNQTAYPLTASASPKATYYSYPNIRNEIPVDPRSSIYNYAFEDHMNRLSRSQRGMFPPRYQPYERERRI